MDWRARGERHVGRRPALHQRSATEYAAGLDGHQRKDYEPAAAAAGLLPRAGAGAGWQDGSGQANRYGHDIEPLARRSDQWQGPPGRDARTGPELRAGIL